MTDPAPIGHIPAERVLHLARELARRGGPAVPGGAVELAHLPVSGPAEVLSAGRALPRAGAPGAGAGSGSAAAAIADRDFLAASGRPLPAADQAADVAGDGARRTYSTYRHAFNHLSRSWRPLLPGSVLLNLFHPTRQWAAHYYVHALAAFSHCTVLPAGPFEPRDIADWLVTFQESGVDAVAGPPSVLADLARGVLDSGGELPVRTLIWMAEPWTYTRRTVVAAAFPEAGFWGNHGSVDTYVVAANTPDCDANVLHLLPNQVLEPDPKGALLTRIGGGWTVPLLRYRTGDLVAPSRCRCGEPDGLRVVGRGADSIKLFGTLTGVGEVLRVLRALPGVRQAQLILTGPDRGLRVATALEARYVGEADEGLVLGHLLAEFDDLRDVVRQHPEALLARRVGRLIRSPASGSIRPVIWRTGP